MRKIVIIVRCKNCPYYKAPIDKYSEIGTCRKVGKKTVAKTIPEWCPLETSPDDGYEKL